MKPSSPIRLVCRASCMKQRGFTLVELMVSITLGMLIVAALLALYLNITRTNNEMAKANLQIENGRFAIQLLQSDLVHAGFWGEARPPVPTAVPANPCLAPSAWDAAYKANMLAFPVLGYDSASVPSTCGTVTGAQDNSDVVVVRHANTCTSGSAGCDGGADTGPHIQVSSCNMTPPEPGYVIHSSTFPLHKKDCTTIEDIRRKVVSSIYFVSDNTLMRSSLVNGTYQAAQPLIEGIEAMRIEYGIDNLGKNGAAVSVTNPGDGSPDTYVSCAPCTLDELRNVVSVKIHVLARNLQATLGHTDSKIYQLGNTDAIGPFDDGVKRHVFSTTVRLVNPSSRREAP